MYLQALSNKVEYLKEKTQKTPKTHKRSAKIKWAAHIFCCLKYFLI